MTETEFKQEAATARPKLVSIALRYLKNSDEAEDIVQDAMLRLWQIHAELNLPLMPIASVITRNIAIDRLRHAMPHTAACKPYRRKNARKPMNASTECSTL